MVNPGYKTTEFWVTCLVSVLGLGVMFGLIPNTTDLQGTASILVGAVSTVYTLGRAIVKAAAVKNQPTITTPNE